MANEIGHAFIALIPSFKGAAGQIKSELASAGVGSVVEKELTSKATSAGNRAGGLFSRAFNRVRGNINFPGPSASVLRNIRTYAFALSAVGSLTVGLGLKTASSFEQAKIAFTTILGSAKQAKQLFGSLVQFAKKTPFDLPGVVSATQKLLAFGVGVKKVKPELRALGDAAAGLSLGTEGLDRLTTAVGQIQAKGKLQSDELLQLTEAGVPALRILANQFGLSTSALQTYVTKGLIPANKAIPALLSGLETGTTGLAGTTAKFGGLMRKQSKTLGGVFSNLKDSLTVGLARAVKPLVPVLKDAIPGATRAVSRGLKAASRDLVEFLHGLGLIKDRSKGTSTAFEQLGSVVRGTFNAVRGVLGFISSHARIFKPLAAGILGAVVALKAFRLVMIGVNLVMDANPISLVVLALGALVAGFIYAYKQSETFRKVVQAVFHGLERGVGAFVGVNVRGFKLIVDIWLGAAGLIVHAAASAFGWIPGLGGKLKGAAKAFDGFRADVDSTLSGIASDAFSFGRAAGANFAGGFGAGVSGLGQAVENGIKGIIDATKKHAKKKTGPTSFTPVGLGVGDALSAGLDSAGSKVQQSASSLVDKILGPLKTLLQKAKDLAKSVTDTILGDTGFGAILNQTDAFGQTGFGTSVKAIIAGFVDQKRQVLQFRRELRLLEKRGLSAGAIEDIANLGLAQGGQLADTLAGATRKQLRRISHLRRGTRQGAQAIGADVAGEKFGARIAKEIAKTNRAIEKASKDTELGPKTMRKLTGGFAKEKKAAKVYLDTRGLDHHEGQVVASLV